MHLRLFVSLVIVWLSALSSARNLAAQELTPGELARVEDWYRRTALRTGDGQWGIVVGTMNGRVLWSLLVLAHWADAYLGPARAVPGTLRR